LGYAVGTKTKVVLESDDFAQLSDRLQSFNIQVADFEATIDKSLEGDFVFIDPPYTVKHNLNGFVKYNEKLFSWSDQIHLRNAVSRAILSGVKVLVLNANHSSVHSL